MSPLARRLSPLPAVAAGALAVLGEAAAWAWPAALLLPLALLAPLAGRTQRRALALGLCLLGVLAASRLHLASIENERERQAPQALEQRLAQAQARADGLIRQLGTLAEAAARLVPPAPAPSGPDSATFDRLQELVARTPGDLAIAIRTPALAPTAWAGSPLELPDTAAMIDGVSNVFVVEGTLSTVLCAAAPLPTVGGQPTGWATAEMPVATRRNIRNEFLRDYDRLTADDGDLEVRYRDVRDPGDRPASWPPLPPGTPSLTREIRSPEGRVLGTVRATALRPERGLEALRSRYHGGAAALALLLLVVACGRSLTPVRLALGATAARVVLLALGLPFEGALAGPRGGPLLSASADWQTGLGVARGLVASPIDLLLTTAWLAALAGAVLWRAPGPARRPSPAWTLLADAAGAAVLAGCFLALERVTLGAAIDLSAVSILPWETPRLVLQTALLLAVTAALFAYAAVLSFRPSPATPGALLARAVSWAGLGTILALRPPPDAVGLPVVPALLLALLAASLGGTWSRWRPAITGLSPERRALAGVALVAVLAGLLQVSLAHYAEGTLRRAVVDTHAPVVLRQPQWRDYVLRAARRTLDEIGTAGLESPGRRRAVDELAFALWSSTDLAAFGFSSAVELQDAAGRIVSRFALNLPSLAAPQRPLPPSPDWDISRERLTVASAEREVVHAQRPLLSAGQVQGALHVYVGDDYWNLPFLTGRDPYSTLFRSTGRTPRPAQPLQLVVYDASLHPVFSSAARAPTLPSDLARDARGASPGLWTLLAISGQPHEAFVFAEGGLTYAIAYRPAPPGRLLADLIEAAASYALLALALLACLMLVRSLQRRPTLSLGSLLAAVRERFALRLFWAFIAVAVVPLVVLQGLVGRAVAERLRSESDLQALDLAAVARKAVEDYAVFQGTEGEDVEAEPVGDAVLVWVASLIDTDLDVFASGRLIASSKRELYTSGLLSPRLAGPVYASLAIEGRPSALQVARIGDFSYRVVSVPLRLRGEPVHILSIPLALRERDVAAVVDDLARTIRVTAAVFLIAAAGVSLSMSRRISGPVRELTAATRRIAAGDFEARVAASTRDELSALVASFNQMAGELARQRRDLERSNRLAAWTEMARQVAHEVKNPLTPIRLSAEHLRRVRHDPAVDFDETLETCTDVILRQVESLREIVTEFSSFARPPAPSLETLDLAQLLRETTSPYAAVLSPDIVLELDLPSDALPVRGDRRLLERAVVNLLENALQAVGERGHVRVALGAEPDGWRRVEVEDSGPGVEPELRERIFEPFFSTKAAGGGLGLALVRRIAEDHGGTAALESEPGRPTRALLRLPPPRGEADQPREG